MTMSGTGPYQSKLFNFLNRQLIQWGGRLTRGARRLRVTTEWGTQIALYPLYLLAQGGRMAVRQLTTAQTERQRQSQADEMNQDGVRLALADLALPSPTQPTLQGIACDLATKDIMFVDQENSLVPPSQPQTKLKQQISLLLSKQNNPKMQDRLTLQITQRRALPPISGQEAEPWPPVGLLLRGLSWLEQSPVAIAIDLFGESRWHTAVVPPEIYAPELVPPLPPVPFIETLDRRFAQLEARLFSTLNLNLEQVNISPETNGLNQGAIAPEESEAWLTWSDLFTDFPDERPNPESLSSDQSNDRSSLPAIASEAGITDSESQAIALPSTQKMPFTEPGQKEEPINRVLETRPEWIETDALSVGYEQHFLERILKAIDRLLAWVETKAAKFVQKLPFSKNK